MNIMDQIKEIRLRLHLSQAELAAKLGVSFATVNRWEMATASRRKSLSTRSETSVQKTTSTFLSWKVLLLSHQMKTLRFIMVPSPVSRAPLRLLAGTGVTLAKGFTWARIGCSRSH